MEITQPTLSWTESEGPTGNMGTWKHGNVETSPPVSVFVAVKTRNHEGL